MAITASIIGQTFITVMMDGVTHTVNGDHTNYNAIRAALKAKDHELVETLINTRQAVERFIEGKIRIDGDRVFYGSFEIKGSVVDRILEMLREGFDAEPMVRFLDNLMSNPSKRAVDELYGFLEATALPITEDGHFLAYKKVTADYRDFYTGKMDNSVGSILEVPRNQVDEDKDRTCSHGLHFCSLSYLPHYHGGSGRVVILKINPRDVVAIPSDYNNAKGRACRYEIVGEHESGDRERKDYFTAPVYRAETNDVAPAAKGNPSLIGYNKGRGDAGNGSPYNDWTTDFHGQDACRYAESYRSGYRSLVPESDDDEFQDEDDYDRGYDSGADKAIRDSEAAQAYDCSTPYGETGTFQDGFENGYEDHYRVDWVKVGYEAAVLAVNTKAPYDDTPPKSCSQTSEYRQGYADGWYESKVARI